MECMRCLISLLVPKIIRPQFFFVVPIDLALVATLDGDAVSVSAGIGPGLYVVATRDEGYFGTGSTTRVAAGVLALIRFSIPVHERVRLVGDLVYDGFKMPGVNPIYGDGGWFDGFSLSVGVVARL